MRRAIVVLVVLIGALAMGLWWWSNGANAAMPAPSTTHRSGADNVVAADAAAERDSSTVADATAGDINLQRTEEQRPGARPFPDDAKWIEITVVDTNDTAIAGAEVGWYRDSDYQQLEAEERGDARMLGWRQDPMRIVAVIGWIAFADQDGKLRVAISGPTTIAGRHLVLRGRLNLLPGVVAPANGYRLVLGDDDRIDVTVLLHDGTPAAGVPVGLACKSQVQGYSSYLGPGALAITDQDGKATIADLAPHRAELASMMPDPRGREVFVRPFLPGHDEPGESITFEKLPEQAIVLQLPPCGSMQARVEAAITSTDYQVIAARQPDGAQFEGWFLAAVDDDGWAHFDHVPVGCRVRIDLAAMQGIGEVFDGPRSEGECRSVVLHADASMVMVKARVLGPDGPVINQSFGLYTPSEELRGHYVVRTDREGRFVAALGHVSESGFAEMLEGQLVTSTTGVQHGRAVLPPQRFRAGITDLGDLRLDPGVLLVAGQLLVDGEVSREQWPKAQVYVAQLEQSHDGEEEWNTYTWGPVDPATGRFEVRGTATNQRLRVHLSGEALLPHSPVEFRSGTRDLILDVKLGHHLDVSVLLPEQMPLDQLICELAEAAPLEAAEPNQTWPQREQGARHHLLWDALPTGRYTLRVAVAGGTLVKITDIELPQPAGGDARLVDLDLRPMVRTTSVRIRTEQQDPDGDYFYVSLLDDETRQRRAVSGAGQIELLLPRRPISAMVVMHGHNPVATTIDSDTLEVRMHEWQKVTLHLLDVPEQLADANLYVQLIGTDYEQVEQRMEELAIEDEPGMLSPSHQYNSLHGGKCVAPIGDGPHRVALFAYNNDHNYEFEVVQPSVVNPTTGIVTLRVPAEQWQRAIAALAKDK